MLKKFAAAIAGVAILAAAVLTVVTLIASPSGVDADFRKQQGVSAAIYAPRPKVTATPALPEGTPTSDTTLSPETTASPDVTTLASPTETPQPEASPTTTPDVAASPPPVQSPVP